MVKPLSNAGPVARFRLPVKIYYEDTDCVGVVYHANYLRYLERARTEALAEAGHSVAEWAANGVQFVVHRLEITYKAGAKLEDRLEVLSSARPVSDYRLRFEQLIDRVSDGRRIIEAEVDLACIDRDGRLIPIPRELLALAPK